jgi:hypothetical protein
MNPKISRYDLGLRSLPSSPLIYMCVCVCVRVCACVCAHSNT